MTIVNAFKKFFLKLNGSTPSGNTIAEVIRNGADSVQLNEADKTEIVLVSSTEDSTKKFSITVDDSGAITATEIE